MSNNFDENFYGVMDTKMMCFRFKFFCSTDKAAEREFGDVVNNPKSVFAQHPDDYALYLLGHFDTSKGLVAPVSPIQLLGFATEYVQASNAKEVVQ